MRVALLSSTETGRRCLNEALVPTDEVEMAGILSTPECIEISYADEPVEIATYHDFRSDARKLGCPYAEFGALSGPEGYLRHLRDWEPDLLVALGWYYMVPDVVRDYVPLGCVGIHCSLLPKYRGGAPIPWAIIEGEDETGTTLFYLEEGVDTGDIIGQERVPIRAEDSVADVYNRATDASVRLLREMLPRLADGTAPRIPQQEERATRYPQRSPDDGLINWSQDARRIYNFVRAQTRPYPGAFTWLGEQLLKVWWVEPAEPDAGGDEPGVVVSVDAAAGTVTVRCGQGEAVRLTDAALESGPGLEKLIAAGTLEPGARLGQKSCT